MGRRSSYPIIFDEAKTVSIADLKRYGYLQPGHRSGELRWSCRGRQTGEVGIAVHIWADEGYLAFNYTYDRVNYYRYEVRLEARPTNLGIGKRWYFICYRTGKRCTKLFMGNDYFQHRSGIPGALYDSQTRSHFYRNLDKYFRAEELADRPYFKTHYRGKPTKRYMQVIKAQVRAEHLAGTALRTLRR